MSCSEILTTDGTLRLIFCPGQAEVIRIVASKVAVGLVSWRTVSLAYTAVFALMLAAIYVSMVEKLYDIVSYSFKPKVVLRLDWGQHRCLLW